RADRLLGREVAQGGVQPWIGPSGGIREMIHAVRINDGSGGIYLQARDQVNTMRTDISDRENRVLQHLALNVNVVLDHVWSRVDRVIPRQRLRRNGRIGQRGREWIDGLVCRRIAGSDEC